jgi:hypothetical protein
LYGVALPWLALHSVGFSECTSRALPFCTALHCLGSFCTAQGPRSASLVHWLFVRCCTALDTFHHAGSSSASPVYCLFVRRCTALDALHRTGSSKCTARALPFCMALDCLGSFSSTWGPDNAFCIMLHCFGSLLHRAVFWQCIARGALFFLFLMMRGR